MNSKNEVTVVFPSAVYSLDAVKRAAYVFMDRVTVIVEPGPNELRCVLRPLSDEDPSNIERDFHREVLDQDLRLTIEAATEPLRNMILGLAFSRIVQNG